MQIIVIGAGVVELAIARALARRGHEIIVAEQADSIGGGISSRNSEVIHGGMYYPSGSLRARHCVAGRRALYAYCARHGVPHRKLGKLIVATDDAEARKIEAIAAQGAANAVEGLTLRDAAGLRALEPNLRGVAALWSPETGIVDTHALMLSLLGEIEDHGGALALRTPVVRMRRASGRWLVDCGGAAPDRIAVDAVVNSAGLDAQAVARSVEPYPAARIPPLVYAKGNYFGCAGPRAFSRLVYPAPVEGGLGVHATMDLAGRVRFGPDVEWIDRLDYRVAPERADRFYAAIRRYWPGLPNGALTPDYAGIRPKLTGPGEPAADFLIDGPAEHGLPGLVQLFGIESPGLTSSLSMAEEVADRLEA